MNWVTCCLIPRRFLMRKTQFTLNIDTIALNRIISGKLFRTNKEGYISVPSKLRQFDHLIDMKLVENYGINLK